jgi:DNA topoisomerase-1
LATVVRLLEATLIRIGNDEYARHNRSYGLTTLNDRHARVHGKRVHFTFTGKSRIRHDIHVDDAGLARIVKQCQELPGQQLFQYLDDRNAVRDLTSSDVNAYLREITGKDFTAKDFRTWAGTVIAARAFQEFEEFDSKTQARKNILRAIDTVARRLGNTKAVCRKCYVHPAVIDAYLDGSFIQQVRRRVEGELKRSLTRLRPEEAVVLAFLQKRLRRESRYTRRPL